MAERQKPSVRAAVIAAAGVVAAMTLVAAAVSALVYSRIESLLVRVSEEQGTTLAQALTLSEISNRYAAGGGELEAARNPLQRQNAMVALAQHAHSLHEVIARLRRIPMTADGMPAIERLARELESTLATQNQQVEERLRLEVLARHHRAELARVQAALDRLLARAGPGMSGMGEDAPLRALEIAAGRLLMRLASAGQIDEPAALRPARADAETARARFVAALARLPAGSAEREEGERLLTAIDALVGGRDGVFSVRAAGFAVRAAIDATAARGREVVTRLGIAVSRLVADVEAETAATKTAMRDQIATGRLYLLAVAAATFLGPLAIVWLAVSGTIVRPLARLAAATRRIAAGDLRTPIPTAGHAEFHEIAEALAVFRDNIAALAQRTADLAASEEAQRQAREAAERALAELRAMQEQLVQSEKMAALAGVVAGVAHEVNTPLGITLTSASLLADELAAMDRLLAEGKLRRADFEQFLGRAREIADLIQGNMNRAAALVQAFKQVAADQSSERRRVFDLRDTIEQTVISVKPATDKAGHRVTVDCPPGLEMDSYPGALSQVLTVLVMNSIDHAFAPGTHGAITISATPDGNGGVRLDYRDDGRGVAPDARRRVFEPFFTTRRAAGNTGLGLHIAYNIAQKSLHGRLDMPLPDEESGAAAPGAHFVLVMPAILPAEAGDGETVRA